MDGLDYREPNVSHQTTSATQERQQWIRLWLDHMDACQLLLRAGLLNTIGPNGDLREAYRSWYKQQMREHDAMLVRMAERFDKVRGDAS
jgi:hypothetical protein